MKGALGTRPARATGLLLGAWLLLGLLLDLRYPGPGAWRPSFDATVVFLVLAAVAWRGRRVPAAALAALGVVVLVVRLFRFGDGITRRYFGRPFSLALDLPTSPELVRLLRSTLSGAVFLAAIGSAVVVAVAVGLAAAWAAREGERCLRAREPRRYFAALVGTLLAVSPFLPWRSEGPWGAFGASVVPRLVHEVRDIRGLPQRRREAAERVRLVDQSLRRSPHDLRGLERSSVFLFLIESYGATVIDRPEHARIVEPIYAAVEARLHAAGFQVASSLLSSPTYAGRSWLAQQTLATAVRTDDRVLDAEVQRQRPTTMAALFHGAGYQTVLVQPGSTHKNLQRWVYDFDRVYSAWDLDYRGPPFRWSPMPDQYVVDFIHRRVVAGAAAPLLVEYALTSSHAPWSDQPTLVEKWSAIGDGRVYAGLARGEFPIGWTNLADGSLAYLRSVAYDLEVLVRYAIERAPAGALVVILGDHQPVAEVTGWSPSHAVPVHVISRNAALVAPFRARGYGDGMRPPANPAPAGMETFLPALLADFSRR
jgi:hypothetical protein